jgi:hypothetical protein
VIGVSSSGEEVVCLISSLSEGVAICSGSLSIEGLVVWSIFSLVACEVVLAVFSPI